MMTVRRPAKVKRTPAKRIVDAVEGSGIRRDEPILIAGVALPQRAQQRIARSETTIGFLNMFFLFSISVPFIRALVFKTAF